MIQIATVILLWFVSWPSSASDADWRGVFGELGEQVRELHKYNTPQFLALPVLTQAQLGSSEKKLLVLGRKLLFSLYRVESGYNRLGRGAWIAATKYLFEIDGDISRKAAYGNLVIKLRVNEIILESIRNRLLAPGVTSDEVGELLEILEKLRNHLPDRLSAWAIHTSLKGYFVEPKALSADVGSLERYESSFPELARKALEVITFQGAKKAYELEAEAHRRDSSLVNLWDAPSGSMVLGATENILLSWLRVKALALTIFHKGTDEVAWRELNEQWFQSRLENEPWRKFLYLSFPQAVFDAPKLRISYTGPNCRSAKECM